MIGGIILAAGSSRRFGDDKRKRELSTGHSVLVETINHAVSTLQQLLIVLRWGDQPFIEELAKDVTDPNVEFFRAPDSALGMAHSLANGIHHVKEWEGAVVMLGDMPYIKADTIKEVLNTFITHQDSSPIVYPTYKGKPGHPVLFHQDYFGEIEVLEGDIGARAVVDAHPDKVVEVEVDDEGILKDIDTPDDIAS